MNLITRANLDGVTCAVFITKMESIERIIFAQPKDIEDGAVKVKHGDVITNLPFHYNAVLWFDHHDKAEESTSVLVKARGKRGISPSAARLVYEYYNSPDLRQYEDLVRETDRFDGADLTINDVLDPKGWILLGYTLDPFMGKEVFHDYTNLIIREIKKGASIEQILEISEVKEQIESYRRNAEIFKERVKFISRIDGNVIVTDARQADLMPIGNRFISFALYPEQNVQITLTLHKEKSKVRVRIGRSIFNQTCKIHLGHLTAEYGGGGLEGAAGCLLNPHEADLKIKEIIERLKE